MTPQTGDTAPDFESETSEVVLGHPTHNGGAAKDLFRAIARSTACSSMVFSGLLAWTSLNAHLPSQAQVPARNGTGNFQTRIREFFSRNREF